MSLDKAQLRQSILTQRRALSPYDVDLYSGQICEHLCADERVKRAGAVHVYLSSQAQREVDTMNFIQWCFRQHKAVFVPFVTDTDHMLHCRLHPSHSTDELSAMLKMGKYGIPEPVAVEPMTDQQLQVDLVIVPGVAFDKRGYRLGYGKGYYDKFLATRPKWVHTMGLCYSNCLVEEIPCEAHDQPVKALVCENQTILAQSV